MLSVLIPVFNWDITELVAEINRQCTQEEINFEVCALDDCSTNETIKNVNSQINYFHFKLIQLENNVGNAEARNILARSAKYNWLLFLDADMMPADDQFISRYIKEMKSHEFDIMSGGIIYPQKVSTEFTLKWIHGKETEEQIQGKDPYLEIRGNNFLIKKEIFLQNPFGGLPESYGYVDTHFGLKLKESGARVKIIDNPCVHLGLESNEKFVNKYRKSVRNAFWLYHHYPEMAKNLRLVQTYKKVKKWGLKRPIRMLFSISENKLMQNLISEKPSLFAFQLYKLGYICTLREE